MTGEQAPKFTETFGTSCKAPGASLTPILDTASISCMFQSQGGKKKQILALVSYLLCSSTSHWEKQCGFIPAKTTNHLSIQYTGL